jgi:hypothetical protein
MLGSDCHVARTAPHAASGMEVLEAGAIISFTTTVERPARLSQLYSLL